MHTTHHSFEEVAEFCEAYLEARMGREIGMTFGAAVQALGRLATQPGGETDPDRSCLNERLDHLLLEFSKRFIAYHASVRGEKLRPLEPASLPTNLTYDGRRPGA